MEDIQTVPSVMGAPKIDYSGMVYENIITYLPDHKNSKASHKLEVMEAYSESGDMLAIADKYSMDFKQLIYWARTPWWTKGMDLLLAHKVNSLRPSWVHIQEMALKKLKRAVDIGEQVLTKDGNIVHKEISVKDLLAISVAAQTQNNALKLIEEKEHDANRQSVDALTELAKAFTSAAKNVNINKEGIPTQESTHNRIIDINPSENADADAADADDQWR